MVYAAQVKHTVKCKLTSSQIKVSFRILHRAGIESGCTVFVLIPIQYSLKFQHVYDITKLNAFRAFHITVNKIYNEMGSFLCIIWLTRRLHLFLIVVYGACALLRIVLAEPIKNFFKMYFIKNVMQIYRLHGVI